MKNIFLAAMALSLLASCSSSDDSNVAPIEQISEGTVFGTAEKPLNVGGPNQPNQVYIDLSDESTVEAPRDSWDLGFYNGSDFKVILNNSLMMAVKQLETTDITAVQTADNTVAVGTFDNQNMAYIDNPNGALSGTAFGNIATSEATAKVYLLNLGNKVPTTAPATGSVNTAGEKRGWKKIKIWQEGNSYKVQYADLDATAPAVVTIAKEAAYNFTFLNLTVGSTVMVEPEKDKWDLNFTTFTNEVFQDGASFGAYFYSDYVITNNKAGVSAVKIEGDNAAYDAFTLNAFTSGSYTLDTDQRAIGADWRDVFTQTVFDDVFFVVKDGAGNLYKLKFISMLSTEGERGYPVFQYALLQ